MCLKALIRNVTFPAVQNFLHIYAEQDLRAPNTVMEPSGLNKMSSRILMGVKLFAARPPGGRTCFGKSMWMFNWDGHSQTARKRLEIKDIIYLLSPSQLESQKNFFGFYIVSRSLGALRALTSSWRPFGPFDFVLRALRALRPVRWARLRSGLPFLIFFDHFDRF